MRKVLSTLAAVLASGLVAFATTLPFVPSNPTFSDPSAIVATLNAVINQLNGNVGYTGTAQGVVSIGAFCSGSAASGSAVTCNGQRGTAAYTAITVGANGTSTQTITNSSVTAASNCSGQLQTATGAAGSTPFVSSITASAGSLSVILGNGSATSTGSVTLTVGFNCWS